MALIMLVKEKELMIGRVKKYILLVILFYFLNFVLSVATLFVKGSDLRNKAEIIPVII